MFTGLDECKEFWEQHARTDPLWAILTEPGKKGRKWDLHSFLETGSRETSLLLFQLHQLKIVINRGKALDFGCGVGRLTQPLASVFDEVVGVDISPTMIRLAQKLNRHPNQIRYVCNIREDLGIFASEEFDFIYTDIVLQHIPPPLTLRYLSEFFRILRPSGVLVFQLPSHLRPQEDKQGGTKPMPDGAYRAVIGSDISPRVTLEPRSGIILRSIVRNASVHSWHQPDVGVIRVGNHWLNAIGDTMLIQDDGRTLLPDKLEPGESCGLQLRVTAPSTPGEYLCEMDLVHEGISWFRDKGSATFRFSVEVRASGQDTTSQPVALEHVSKRQLALSAASEAKVLSMSEDLYEELPADITPPRDFPMYGVHREMICDLIADHGGELVFLEEDERCGNEWVGYRYFVRKLHQRRSSPSDEVRDDQAEA